MPKNKVLFPVSQAVYLKFSQQTPAEIWEQFEGSFALKIVPNPNDLTSQSGEDLIGNAILSDYSPRGTSAGYEFQLRYSLYAYYKILQEVQKEATGTVPPTQIVMVDFVNPDPEDTQESGGTIKGFTKRYGRITELGLIGSTEFKFTQNFVPSAGQFLKEYRCQGTRFVFEETGVPNEMAISAPAGTVSIFPTAGEVSITYLGNETITDGFSDTFVEIEKRRIVLEVDTRLNDVNLVSSLIALRNSCIVNQVFTPATLAYPELGTLEGVISNIRTRGAYSSRINKATPTTTDTVTQGFSFRFTQL